MKVLETVWRVWLDGQPEGEDIHIRDGVFTAVLSARAQVGSLVDFRTKDVLIEPKEIVNKKLGDVLRVSIDGELWEFAPGHIHDFRMNYILEGPVGMAEVNATWHLRLVSMKMEKK